MKSPYIKPEHPTKVLQEKGDCIILHYPIRMMNATHGHVLNVHFKAPQLNPVLPSAIAVCGTKRGWDRAT